MDAAVLVFVCVLVISLWGSAISALVSAVRLPGYAWQSAKRSKNGTVLGILLTGGIGGAYYWLSIRQSGQGSTEPDPASSEARPVDERRLVVDLAGVFAGYAPGRRAPNAQ